MHARKTLHLTAAVALALAIAGCSTNTTNQSATDQTPASVESSAASVDGDV
ncbi:Hypothetical protein AAM4_1576, partial [Actinomyces succiniciruminis]